MKRIAFAVALAAFVLASPFRLARAQELKIAFIDSERIFAEYEGVKEAKDIFDRDVQEWQAEANKKEKEIADLKAELESQSLMLSDSKRQEKEAELQRLMSEYDGFVQMLWGPGGKIAKRNEELTRPIIAKIKAVLDKIAGEEGYDLVLDAADGNVVYGSPELDLTDRVLKELRAVE